MTQSGFGGVTCMGRITWAIGHETVVMAVAVTPDDFEEIPVKVQPGPDGEPLKWIGKRAYVFPLQTGSQQGDA